MGGTLTVIVTIEQGRKGRSDVMREESRSATDALASAVEGVRRPRSIIRIVAVNYFSPALILLEGLRYHCCGCCHELGIKGIAVLNPAITTSRFEDAI